MKTFDPCDDEVKGRVAEMVRRFHGELKRAEVTFDLLFVSNDSETEPALKLHGTRCLAIVKIVSTKDRALDRADAEILIDRDAYGTMSGPQRDALLDHELEHLLVRYDEDGKLLTDCQYRPKLKMKPHDVEIGWFESVAQRHGEHSIEVQQARKMTQRFGQAFFPFMQAEVHA